MITSPTSSTSVQIYAVLHERRHYRRIEAQTGVRRETVSRYDAMRRSNAAKTFPGSDASPPSESPDLPLGEDSKAAKTFAGSEGNPATTFPGSPPRPRFAAAVYRTAITEKLDAGLTLQRIWQDLVEEYGYGFSAGESTTHDSLSFGDCWRTNRPPARLGRTRRSAFSATLTSVKF